MRERHSSIFSGFADDAPQGTRFARFASRLRDWGESLARRAVRTPEAASTDAALSSRLQSVMSNPAVRERLRVHLASRCGSENVDFLIRYWTFSRSGNALERYQQLRVIMHSFVRDGCDRPVRLKDANRRRLLHEWARYSRGNRVPAQVRLRALDDAATEIEQTVLAHSSFLMDRVAP